MSSPAPVPSSPVIDPRGPPPGSGQVSSAVRRLLAPRHTPLAHPPTVRYKGHLPMIPRYSRPALAALWDDKYRFELWLDVELAACAAMERAGSVPAGTAARVREAAAG